MRKFIVSNLLLLLVLVGAASGFFISNVSWWGLHLGDRDLNRMYQSTESLLQISAVESRLLESNGLFLDILKRRQFSDADGWELQNMLTVARLVIEAALAREETRGVHLRTDFPAADDARWKRRISFRREA